jgi:mRNA-degrading endonuclease YafQ of YafQ-DinJ toxin-antitoxin module
MMKVELHRSFVKSYRQRIRPNRKLCLQVERRVTLFKKNRPDPFLKDHALIGRQQHLRSFSLGGDLRIVYYLASENLAIFIDIGSHNQVY